MVSAQQANELKASSASLATVPNQGTVAESRAEATFIHFPYGLPGLPGAYRFVLEALAGCAHRFLLLRSVDDPDLRLVVMPALAADKPVVAEQHLRDACAAVGWEREHVAVLFVVTLAAGANGIEAYVNLRAPILLDTGRALAIQVVLPDPSYPFRCPLDRPAAA